MTLTLPPHILREQRVERDRRILRCTTMDDRRCQEYTTKLKHLSPDMWMVRAQDTVDSDLPLRPGYYHILVVNEDEAMTVIPITNNGAYVEPGDWIFDHLPRMNLRDRRVRDRLAEQEREAEQAAEKERLEGQERRLEVAREVVLSATRAQVSMDRTIPWTQNSQGRREAVRRGMYERGRATAHRPRSTCTICGKSIQDAWMERHMRSHA